MSIWRGWAKASRIADSVISLKVTRCVLVARHVRGFGHMPGDRLALAVEVGGEEDHVRGLGRLGDLGDLLAPVFEITYSGSKSWSTSTPNLPLPGFSGRSRT